MGSNGTVFLVGAGPGARDLITVRGLSCLRRAQVVLYEQRWHAALLDEVSAGALLIDVGEGGGVAPQVVEQARQGRIVVRLAHGDPFACGSGSAEARALADAGIPFEVVPGVATAWAIPEAAGIPLTSSFEVWRDGARAPRTAVVELEAGRLAETAARLREEGYPDATPAALIRAGGTPRQQTLVATLEGIAKMAGEPEAPATLVVGEVVTLRDQLAWFERRPLFGHQVLVTRPRPQAAETCQLLESLGAETVVMPTIRLRPPTDREPLRRAVRALSSYDYVIFTSANALPPFREALAEAGHDCRALAGLTVCALGPGTAAALATMGLVADVVPAEHLAEGLLTLLSRRALAGRRVLLPRAAVARDVLPKGLAELGAAVDVVPVYEAGLPEPAELAAGLLSLEQGAVDTLTFTSASIVHNFATILGPRLQVLCAGKVVAALGPVTREACQQVGLTVDVMPASYTVPALVDAIVEHYETSLG